MYRRIFTWLLVSTLAACAAAEGPVSSKRPPRPAEMVRTLGCGPNEVAVCIEINCDAEDYRCAPRGSARDLLTGEFEPPQ